MFDVPVVIIEGEFNDFYKTKHGADNFKMWVQYDTGILLKLEEYSKGDEVVIGLETTSFKLNQKFNDGEFKTEMPSNYKLGSLIENE
jgi:outer membrane lipoprotein-sorting protein